MNFKKSVFAARKVIVLFISVAMIASVFASMGVANAFTFGASLSFPEQYTYFPFDGTDNGGTPFAFYVSLTGGSPNANYYYRTYFYYSNQSSGYVWDGLNNKWTKTINSTPTASLPEIRTDSSGNWSGWIFCKTDSNQNYSGTVKFRIRFYLATNTSTKVTNTVSTVHFMDMDGTHNGQQNVDTQGGWIEGHAYDENGNAVSDFVVVVKNSSGEIVGAYSTENNGIDEGYSTDMGYYKVAVPEGSGYSVELWDPSTNQIVGSAVTGVSVSAHSVTSNIDINHSTSSGPQVTSTVPASNATNVSVTTIISATFDKDMDSSTINTSTFTVKDSSNNSVSGTVTYNSNTKTATFTPSTSLASGTTYTATISGSVKDTDGNQMGSDYSWSFTTETQIANPSVETLDATNITEDSATLNGKLDSTGGDSSVTVYFKYSQDGINWTETTHQTLSAPGNFSANISGLVSGTAYKFVAIAENSTGTPVSGSEKTFTTKLSGSPVVLFDNTKDETAGNADWTIDGAYSDWADALKSAGFTVQSLNSGSITSSVLQNVNVLVIPEPQDTFSSDEIKAIEDFVSNGGGLVFIADHSGSDRNNNGHDSPHIFNQSFKDNNGDPYFGFTFNYDNFSEHPITNVDHTIYPELTDGVNSIGEWGASSIKISNVTAVKGVIFKSDGTPVVVGAEIGAGRVAAIGDSSPFDDGTPDSQNQHDNLYDGWNEYDDAKLAVDMVKWCAAAKLSSPKIIATVPQDGATNVPVNINQIAATFDRPMNGDSIKASGAFVLKDSGGNLVSGRVYYDKNLKVASFVPDHTLKYGETYTAVISKDVEDLLGNKLGKDYSWSFTTENVVLPKVVMTIPPDGATDVPVTTIVAAAFSVAVRSGCGNPVCINDKTFTVTDSDGNKVDGTVEYYANYYHNGLYVTNVAVFTPSAPLKANTTYTAKIAKTVTDINGNAMGKDYIWSFTTAMAIMPIGAVRNMPLGTQVYIEGTVTLPTGTLFTNNREFYLQDGTGGIAVYYGRGGLPDLKEGYVVKVKGILSKYGVLEVKPGSVSDVEIVSDTNVPVPPLPIPLNLVSESAGWLIVTKGTVQGNVVSKRSYSYFTISNGATSVKVFVDKDTHIDLSEISNGKEVLIRGIAEVYSSHGNSTPEIIVRYQSDITIIEGPSAPRYLLAVGGVGEITLSWLPSVPGKYPIAGYAIYRGTAPGQEGNEPIAVVGPMIPAYIDTNVVAGVKYYYVVKAFDNQDPPNYSPKSNEASATALGNVPGGKGNKWNYNNDNTPPSLNVKPLTITNSSYPDITNKNYESVLISASDNSGKVSKLVVINNNITMFVISDFSGKKSLTVPLFEGINDITILAYDPFGNVARKAIRIISDTKPPIVKVKNLPKSVMSGNLVITGTALDITTSVASLKVNGKEIPVVNGKFSCVVPLKAGKNTITIVAVDKAGNKFEKTFEVTKVSNNSVRSKVINLSIGSSYMVVNGVKEKIDAQGSKPIIKNNRTLLPVRSLIEALGGTVEWNAKTRQVTISLDGNTIVLTIGKNTALVNGIETPIDPNNPNVVPIIINGRTYLPLRFIAEHLNCTVEWSPSTKTITIYYFG